MDKGIILLLTDRHSDLYASVCAMELAKRTTKTVHVVLAENGGAETIAPGRDDHLELVDFMVRWGEMDGVRVCCHILAGDFDNTLIGLCLTHHITWVVMGVKDHQAQREKSRWIATLRKKLANDRHWYMRSFSGLMVGPWDNETFARILAGINQT